MAWQTSHHQHAGLPQELSACVLQPPSKGQVTTLEGYSTLASGHAGELWQVSGSQLVRWKVMWPCDHASHPCSESQHWRRDREPCGSWGVKNSLQPQKLNWPWINCSASASAAVTLCRPWVSNPAQAACQTACIQITETQHVTEYTLSLRKTGLLFSVLCRRNYSPSSSKMTPWWSRGARGATFLGHLSAQYNTSAALLLNALEVHDPLQFTAALPMPNRCWHDRRCMGQEEKPTQISMHLSLVCVTLPSCQPQHNLLWTPMPISLNKKFFCSQSFRWIHLQQPIMHLPLNTSTLAASKECPGDGNTAPSKGKSCHLEGNGVARCSARVRWWHVLRTATTTTEQISGCST